MITGNAIACCTESFVGLRAHLAVIVVKTQSSSINRNVKIKISDVIVFVMLAECVTSKLASKLNVPTHFGPKINAKRVN